MSQEGIISFFTTRKPIQPEMMLERLLKQLAPERLFPALRSLYENHRWNEFCLLGYGKEHELEELGELTIEQCLTEYREDFPLHISLGSIPLQQTLAKAVLDHIDPQIRGNFVPLSAAVEIGFHDIYECAEHDPEGFLFGRAFLEVCFHGYSSPNDWATFRKQLFALPEMSECRTVLQSLAGPMEQCAYWII
jgi:hypothetical protein